MKLFILVILVFVLFCIFAFLKNISEKEQEDSKKFYKKKEFLFDTVHEYNLFKILNELFGDKYYIFPQINYGHIFEPLGTDFISKRAGRSHIDRKSADFVFCDKVNIKVLLIIELDGYVHNFNKKRDRDGFIDKTCEDTGIPIVHFKNGDTDREFIKRTILEKLQ